MGLGKSIQSIACCSYYQDDWPVLVICPQIVRSNWKNEFLQNLPGLVKEDDILIIKTTKDKKFLPNYVDNEELKSIENDKKECKNKQEEMLR